MTVHRDVKPSNLLFGELLEVCASLPESSVDAVICDPPYGLRFMGARWDYELPGVDRWAAISRVAKPGAPLLAFGGTRTYHRLVCEIEDAGWEIRDSLMWLHGQGFPKSHNGSWGGTALKPGWEPIVLARKPLSGTVAQTFEAHGTGGLNIDDARIGWHESSSLGRWPANVLLSHHEGCETTGHHTVTSRCGHEGARDGGLTLQGLRRSSGRSTGVGTPRPGTKYMREEQVETWRCHEDCPVRTLDEQSGEVGCTGGDVAAHHATLGFAGGGSGRDRALRRDSGGASRFFYCAKPAKRERGATNDWPTVKPVALMRYLVRLVTRPGATVLDPFMGSGSTGVATLMEGRAFVGVERDAHAMEIAKSRIDALDPLLARAG